MQSRPKSLKPLSGYKDPAPALGKNSHPDEENFRCQRFPLTHAPVSFTTGVFHAGFPFHRYSPVHRH